MPTVACTDGPTSSPAASGRSGGWDERVWQRSPPSAGATPTACASSTTTGTLDTADIWKNDLGTASSPANLCGEEQQNT